MAIVRPENMDFSGQKFSAIIYGSEDAAPPNTKGRSPPPMQNKGVWFSCTLHKLHKSRQRY